MNFDRTELSIAAPYDAPIAILLNTIAGQHKATVTSYNLRSDARLLEVNKRRTSDLAARAAALTEKVLPRSMTGSLTDSMTPKRPYELCVKVKPGHMDFIGWLFVEKAVFSIQLLVGPVLHTLGEVVVTKHNESNNEVSFEARVYMKQDIVWSTVPLESVTGA